MKITTKSKKDRENRTFIRKSFNSYELAVMKGKVLELLSEEKSYNEMIRILKLNNGTLANWRKNDPIFGKAIDLYVSHKRPTNISTSAMRVRKDIPDTKAESNHVIDEVCEALESGTGFEMACLYASISCGAIRKMMTEDLKVMQRLNKAEAMFVVTCTKRILEASKNDWKAAAWLLERRYPSLWGEVKQMEITSRNAHGSLSDTCLDDDKTIDIEPQKVVERIKHMSDKELMDAINKGKRIGT